ncbi:hypothetical protein [Streptomyces qinzhouensis]|uniref:Uncharacterized protein n=1 Tax=Streptomyces qinzhouensis TaxID=2599401 RepID=A0A5B8JHC1_9ACTN|nr:hypothetical protein [Streptomyces qinzhouensis]QDY79734.1 hypothetical protein FQU76_27960 [Streptomyces qinzhouensis]
MKKILESVGGVLLVLGSAGVIRELTGWFPFLGFTERLTENVGLLREQALFTHVVIAVVGFVMVMIGESRSR